MDEAERDQVVVVESEPKAVHMREIAMPMYSASVLDLAWLLVS